MYHTNVMMYVGTEFALVGLLRIHDTARREQVRRRLEESGRTVIDLSAPRIPEFAANSIELTGSSGRLLVMSSRALRALTAAQVGIIRRSAEPIAFDIPSIELAGGSIRCMIAGVHLSQREGCAGERRVSDSASVTTPSPRVQVTA
ncbi:MAG: arginine deiminase-related protein [Acidimicrobiales bacterium]